MNNCCFPESEKQFRPNTKKQYEEGYIPSRPVHGSDELWAIVEKMCMYDADDRYQHMEEVLDDIKQLIYEEELYHKQRHRKSYVLMGGIFLFFGIWFSNMGERMGLGPEDLLWIKIMLFSLAAIMLAYGSALVLKWETPFERDAYTQGTFWRLVILLYMLTTLVGLIYSQPMLKIGLSGTAFCVLWTVREQLLFHYDRFEEQY